MSREYRGLLRITRFYGGGEIAHLDAFCPACDRVHSFSVDLEGHGKWREEDPVWDFDGNWESPTFSPSMLANKDDANEYFPICHSFLKNGHWEYLEDSTHELAGQTVAVPKPDPDMGFQRRHGWHLYPWTDDDGKLLQEREE